MSLPSLLCLIAFTLFACYNILIITRFGIPIHYSETYYLLKEHKHSLRILAPLLWFSLIITIFPAWIMVSREIGTKESDLFEWEIFATVFFILVIIVLSNYKHSPFVATLHYLSAVGAALSFLSWIAFVRPDMLYTVLISLVLIVFAATITKTFRSSFFFWLELGCVFCLTITVFIISIKPKPIINI